MKNKNFLNLFFTFIGLLLIFSIPLQSRAEAFVIHLDYNSHENKLFFNNQEPKDIAYDADLNQPIWTFIKEHENFQGDYIVKYFDLNNIEIFKFQIQKQDGVFDVLAPYFSLATYIRIYTKDDTKILEADVSKYRTCNGNGICEFEKRETILNCMGDCNTKNVVYSEETQKLLKQHNGIIKDEKTGQLFLKKEINQNNAPQKPIPESQSPNYYLYFVITLIILIAVTFGYLWYRKHKNKNSNY